VKNLLREKISTLKQWITEDPQGPISKEKGFDQMTLLELEKEWSFLQARAIAIFTRKLQVEDRWEPGMDSLPLRALRDKASETISPGFTEGDSPIITSIMFKRHTR
jgi:hypothetical protein